MYGIELRKEVRRITRESSSLSVAQIILLCEPCPEPAHLAGDVLRIAEGARILREPYRPEPAGPVVNVLEQVVMDRAVVGDREVAAG
jgi:hypothetical protein